MHGVHIRLASNVHVLLRMMTTSSNAIFEAYDAFAGMADMTHRMIAQTGVEGRSEGR